MNYYEHHIGDYDTATSHLSWEQDLAYRRLLCWYYRKEKPIPADIKEACRQIRATSKSQREAVQVVLEEFFELRTDGWHKDDCDQLIAKFQAGEPEREAKKKNEDTRLQRHRLERSELFAELNASGQHLPWNTRIEDLRNAVARVRNAQSATPATSPETATATPATATQTPIPNTHYPLPNNTHTAADAPGARATKASAVCIALKAEGIAGVSAGHPLLLALLDRGAEVSNFVAAVTSAKDKRDPFAYLLGRVDGQLNEAAAIAAKGRAPTATALSPQGPDPELERIKAHKGAPIPESIRAQMDALKGKVLQ